MDEQNKRNKWIGLLRYLLKVAIILIIVQMMQFLICKGRVPSSSMEPTIMPGDRILFNKASAYCRKPKRGEIVIFERNETKIIKRLIGLPGETIDFIDGKVYIDGIELNEEKYLDSEVVTLPLYNHDKEVEFPYTVPEEGYFFLGDNRSNSFDSRAFGGIKKEAILAIGVYRIQPLDRIGKIK